MTQAGGPADGSASRHAEYRAEESARGRAGWRAWVRPPEGEPFALARALPEHPGLWDLAAEPGVLAHWVSIFRANAAYVKHILAQEAAAGESARAETTAGATAEEQAAERALAIFAGLLEDLETGRASDAIRTIHAVTLVRERLLRAHGVADPYRRLKALEAERWWEEGVRSLERAASGVEPALILGDMLAGNLFDLGSRSTQEAFRAGTLDPAAARARFRDDAAAAIAALDPALRDLLAPAPRPPEAALDGTLVLLADNAGADFLLGVLPAALHFARRFAVVLVANSEPASSDITHAEAEALVARLASRVPALAAALRAGRLRLVPSGTGSPGIDLRFVGPELNRAAAGARWLLIEGQGRGVETNWKTTFRCPALRVAVVKDALVAEAIGVAAGTAIVRGDP